MAGELLAIVYSGFKERLDMLDLQDARDLLDELA